MAPELNLGYIVAELDKARETAFHHQDGATRTRALQKMAHFRAVLLNLLGSSVSYGSRQPFAEIPVWATLEVVKGGFATGGLSAGGPIQDHEDILLESIAVGPKGRRRHRLNEHFFSVEGLSLLSGWLDSGAFEVQAPEEGALLVIAWLIEKGELGRAQKVIHEISPFFDQLRFYPKPLEEPSREVEGTAFLCTVGETVEALQRIRQPEQVETMRESIRIWTPLKDRLVETFLETYEEGWPCQRYPEGWRDRAKALLDECASLRLAHPRCGRPERPRRSTARLIGFLAFCIEAPERLTGKDVGTIRKIVADHFVKWGAADSELRKRKRALQQASASAPTTAEIAQIVLRRLEGMRPDEPLDDFEAVAREIEVAETGEEAWWGRELPIGVRRRLARCRRGSLRLLADQGVLGSAEVLAKVLPQITARHRFAGIEDLRLRRVLEAIYRAFRRRRSLLLLNYESQVRFEELSWVTAAESLVPANNEDVREAARQTLKEATLIALRCFPETIFPNKLIKELSQLATAAEIEIPWVEELAADIFMGDFIDRFRQAAVESADYLGGTLYAAYYRIEPETIGALPPGERYRSSAFGELCRDRAKRPVVKAPGISVAANGVVIEQAQILTTHNLAPLFKALDLRDSLGEELTQLSLRCFDWICRRLQREVNWHTELIFLKNAAYAFRQMVFFLSCAGEEKMGIFAEEARAILSRQPEAFRMRFAEALDGLLAAAGYGEKEFGPDTRIFLGWTLGRHWLSPARRLNPAGKPIG